ncbi:hypothetical protein H6G52_09775 [Limnothrix sp. FACHB-881]|nr:hypothetical protein [Limnothrix sp. FACHB-881]MBD2635648.1 hypothetical protein [Limnothrix sp. FACHB-881]
MAVIRSFCHTTVKPCGPARSPLITVAVAVAMDIAITGRLGVEEQSRLL